MMKSATYALLATIVAAPFADIAQAGDNRTSCAITLKNGYYEADENDNGYTFFWVYDGDDSVLTTARKSKNVAYNKSWETYCEVAGQSYCKVRYGESTLVLEWFLKTVKVNCGSTLTIADSSSGEK